jgi:zinc and cadmium transporter
MNLPEFSVLTWIVLSSLLGGALSVAGAGLVALNVKKTAVPMLISFAIGAMLGAVFLEILPEAIEHASSVQTITGTVLIGILLFFSLEKLVIWRHCHGDHCEVHAVHTEADCLHKIQLSKYLPCKPSTERLLAACKLLACLKQHIHMITRTNTIMKEAV